MAPQGRLGVDSEQCTERMVANGRSQEQQLWLWKHPTKTLPQNPCLDADLKETCSAMKER